MNPAGYRGVFFQPQSQEVVNTRISKRARNLRAGAVTKLSKEEFLVLYKNVCLERVGNALVCPVLHKWVLFWHSRAEMSLNAIILSRLASS